MMLQRGFCPYGSCVRTQSGWVTGCSQAALRLSLRIGLEPQSWPARNPDLLLKVHQKTSIEHPSACAGWRKGVAVPQGRAYRRVVYPI